MKVRSEKVTPVRATYLKSKEIGKVKIVFEGEGKDVELDTTNGSIKW